jgi:hypothetical protein
MSYTRKYPLVITADGDDVESGVTKIDNELDSMIEAMNNTGTINLAGTKRQSVLSASTDSSGNPNYLTASGLTVSIDGSTVPIYLAFAYGFNDAGAVDYLAKINSLVSSAWTLPANQTNYLHVDRDISTGLISYGSSLLSDLYQKIVPSSPTLDQHYFNTNEMKMYRYNGSAQEVKQRIFIAKVVTDSSTATITHYPLKSRVPIITINGNSNIDDVTVRYPVQVRQTVLAGAVDSSGFAAQLSAVSSLLAITELATTTPTITAWANGYDEYGNVDYIQKLTADVTSAWSGLTASSTLYLYKERNASTGTVTYGFTTLAPIYQGYAPSSPATNQYWFDTVRFVGQYWNGSAWVTVQRVFVGECVTGTSSVTSVICYAYKGVYDSGWFAVASSNTSYVKSHNIGIIPLTAESFASNNGTTDMRRINLTNYNTTLAGAGLRDFTKNSANFYVANASTAPEFNNGAFSYGRIICKRW